MAYQNIRSIGRNIGEAITNFAQVLRYYDANPNDIEIGDIELTKPWEAYAGCRYRLTWYSGKGYQVYMQMTGILVTNPDEHSEDCNCVDCQDNS